MVYILYNPLANNKHGYENALKLEERISDKAHMFIDVIETQNITDFVKLLRPEDEIILAGGDGTFNHFINVPGVCEIENKILFYPMGSGNDFVRDLGIDASSLPLVPVNDYIKCLPVAEINGKSYRFVNGIGGGVDSCTCEAGNERRLKKGKPVNYLLVALKQLLLKYSPISVTVIEDGVERKFDKVWFVTIMKGKYFGGGMMISPEADRMREDGKLNSVLVYKVGRFRLLSLFPNVFKGKHIRYTQYVKTQYVETVKVKFDRLLPVQIDGEIIKDVKEFSVTIKQPVKTL